MFLPDVNLWLALVTFDRGMAEYKDVNCTILPRRFETRQLALPPDLRLDVHQVIEPRAIRILIQHSHGKEVDFVICQGRSHGVLFSDGYEKAKAEMGRLTERDRPADWVGKRQANPITKLQIVAGFAFEPFRSVNLNPVTTILRSFNLRRR